MVAALPMLVLLVCLLFGVPIAVALAGSGMFGIWLITGDFAKVHEHRRSRAVQLGRRLPAHHHPDVHPDGLFLGLQRAGARPLCRRGGLAVAHPGRARDRHRVRLRHFRRDVGREHRGRLGDVADRDAGDAPPRLFRGTRGRLDRRRRDARHSHSAQHRDGDLRHRDADLDRQAPDRRRHPGHHRRRLARRHDLLWVVDQPAATRPRHSARRRPSAAPACCGSGRASC